MTIRFLEIYLIKVHVIADDLGYRPPLTICGTQVNTCYCQAQVQVQVPGQVQVRSQVRSVKNYHHHPEGIYAHIHHNAI